MWFASYPKFWHLIKRLFKKLKGKKFCELANSRRTTPGTFSGELIFKQAFFFQLEISSVWRNMTSYKGLRKYVAQRALKRPWQC